MPRPDITRRAIRHFFPLHFLTAAARGRSRALLRCAQNPIPRPRRRRLLLPGSRTASNAQADQSHRLKSVVDLVVLHATVVDDKGQFVPGLDEQ